MVKDFSLMLKISENIIFSSRMLYVLIAPDRVKIQHSGCKLPQIDHSGKSNYIARCSLGPKVTGVLTFNVTLCREYSSTANPTQSAL